MYNEILKTGSENFEILSAAKSLLEAGISVLPCDEKEPVSKIKKWGDLRKRPLNEKNYQYYFDSASQIAIICGETKGSSLPIEAIDVDSHNDLSGKLNNVLLAAIKYSMPEVFEKLVIEKSTKGGLHLLYRCRQIGGNNSEIARRHAIPEERANGERSLVLIETRGSGGYIVCSPSLGYKTMQGELSDIQEISPEERELLLNICRSFDRTGKLELPGVSKKKLDAPDAPWIVFNQNHDYAWIAEALQKAGWTISNESDSLIPVLRPGNAKSKTSGSIWKESNCLYLFSSSTEFEAGKPYTAFGVYAQLIHDGNWKSAAKELGTQGVGTWKERDHEFYSVNENGKLEIKTGSIGDWLKDIGFYKHRDSINEFRIVQVVENIVRFVSYDLIKKTFLDYIEKDTKAHDPKIFDAFNNKTADLFSEGGGIISRLEDLNENRFLKSEKGKNWFFFKNAAVLVEEAEKQVVPYSELEGLIWENQVHQRNYKEAEGDCDMSKFVERISSIKNGDGKWIRRPEKEDVIKRGIGYGLDRYKDPSNAVSLIFTDEFFDEDDIKAEGRTGKDLMCELISQLRHPAVIDGKKFDPSSKFSYQGIDTDTEIVTLLDLQGRFDFEKLFNVTTNALIVEYKHEREFKIPYKKSPKWIITCNYTLKGSSGSHAGRKHEIEFSNYFTKSHSPKQEFGRVLMEEWDEHEWNLFDNYMIGCLQLFMQKGLGNPATESLKRKQLIKDTNINFLQWIDQLYDWGKGIDHIPDRIGKDEFKGQFINKYQDFKNSKVPLSTHKFTQWLKRWCDEYGIGIDGRHADNLGVMEYKFTKPEPKKLDIDIVDEHDEEREILENIGAVLNLGSAPGAFESAPASQNCTGTAPELQTELGEGQLDTWEPVSEVEEF
jgi:Bifunctional DNA primase/polymerase, N-terminal